MIGLPNGRYCAGLEGRGRDADNQHTDNAHVRVFSCDSATADSFTPSRDPSSYAQAVDYQPHLRCMYDGGFVDSKPGKFVFPGTLGESFRKTPKAESRFRLGVKSQIAADLVCNVLWLLRFRRQPSGRWSFCGLGSLLPPDNITNCDAVILTGLAVT
jgi:hypothetical protein